MSSESAAYQAAQQRHHHYMVFGKKQRYIEVFQCSGEDMNHVLTGSTATGPTASANPTAVSASSAVSPVKTGAESAGQGAPGQAAAVAAAAAAASANGLLPPGMFTVPTATSQTTLGLDPNSAILAAAQMQNPLLFSSYPPRPQAAASNHPASHAEMFGMQQQGLLLAPNPMLAAAQMRPQLGLMAASPYAAAAAANPALLQAQQMQLQQQLLQSQLAAQRLLLAPNATGHGASHAVGQTGLIGPQIPGPQSKRSFDQAFTSTTEDSGAKRTNYGTPTISAGPTTYSR